MSPGDRKDPAGNRAASENLISVTPIDTSPLDELAAHNDGAFVVVVEGTGGTFRRRCFLTAASAERSATKALVAGHNARVYLAEPKPLWLLIGGESGG